MATTVEMPRPVRWTVAEFHRMLEAGLLGDGGGFELRDGAIYQSGAPKVWTRDEYYRLGELGLRPELRTELIEGEIVEMMTPSQPHTIARHRTRAALAARLPAGCYIADQDPLAVAARRPSDPLPDLAVIAGSLDDYPDEPPATALLVVEISVASLAYDLGDKLALYARAAIPHYWVLDVVGRRLHACADPIGGGRYGEHADYGDDATGAPPWPAAPVAVADLLPPVR
jgi:Uma2 family endonuclease